MYMYAMIFVYPLDSAKPSTSRVMTPPLKKLSLGTLLKKRVMK
jgi:hypothetical protein